MARHRVKKKSPWRPGIAMLAAGIVIASLAIGAAAHRFGLHQWRSYWQSNRLSKEAAATQRGVALLKQMQAGNLILYFRHASRDRAAQQLGFDLIDVAAKEAMAPACLNAVGQLEAELIGKLFAHGKVPVGTVAASPSCRASQTAQLAFKKIDSVNDTFLFAAAVPLPAPQYRDKLHSALLALQVTPGTNTAVFSHIDTLKHLRPLIVDRSKLLGTEVYKETGFYVLRRDNNRLTVEGVFVDISAFASALIRAQTANAP